MISTSQRANAERIVSLANEFGHLPLNEAGQTVEQVLNLSVPCARLIVAGVVTGVADANDGVNDSAVAEVGYKCAAAIAHATELHGAGWWSERAAEVLA